MAATLRIGIDVGGTFTDFVLLQADGRTHTLKAPSTPDAPERAVREPEPRPAEREPRSALRDRDRDEKQQPRLDEPAAREQAQALIDTAHKVCPYSNATRGNIEVEVRLAGS